MKKILFIFLLFICVFANAQNINLNSDTLLNGNGNIYSNPGDIVIETVVMPDNKLLVFGITANPVVAQFYVSRYYSDGFPDYSFTGSNYTTSFTLPIPGINYARVTTLPNNKFLVYGQSGSDWFIARISGNGTMDFFDGDADDWGFDFDGLLYSSSNQDGTFKDILYDAPNHRFLAVGESFNGIQFNAFVAAIDTNGNYLQSFGSFGTTDFDPDPSTADDHIVIQRIYQHQDGSLYLGGNIYGQSGQRIFVSKLKSDGNLDSSFAVNGSAVFSYGAITKLEDMEFSSKTNQLVLSGSSDGEFLMVNVDLAGNQTFQGIYPQGTSNNSIRDIIIRQDGKVLALGTNFNAGYPESDVLLFNANNALDPNFNSTGKVILSAEVEMTFMHIDPYGRIILGGYSVSYGGDVMRWVMEGNKFTQTVNLPVITAKKYGDSPFNLNATSSSGEPVEYIWDDKNAIDIVNGVVTINRPGTVNIYAVQPGNDSVAGASSSLMQLTIDKGTQTISINISSILKYTLDYDFAPPTATSNFGSYIYYEIGDNSIATVHDDFEGTRYIEILKAGMTTLTAYNTGGGFYDSAGVTIPFEVKVPQFKVSGKDSVAYRGNAKFTFSPYISGYLYDWSYDGDSVEILTTNRPDVVTLIFSDYSTEGNLHCYISTMQGQIVDSSTKYIRLYNDIEEKLPAIQCPVRPDTCEGVFINSFTFQKYSNHNTLCSDNAIADFTNESIKVYLGDVNLIRITIQDTRIITGGPYYYGLWIDYNKDGKFEDDKEFISSAFIKDTVYQLFQFSLPEDLDVGAYRLRIRVIAGSSFGNLACPLPGEIGETEDYRLKVLKHDDLEAPQIITPNGDGLNDYFVIRGVKEKANSRLTIFDRIGNVVYSAQSYDNTFAGLDDEGKMLESGGYYFIYQNGKSSLKGFFELRY